MVIKIDTYRESYKEVCMSAESLGDVFKALSVEQKADLFDSIIDLLISSTDGTSYQAAPASEVSIPNPKKYIVKKATSSKLEYVKEEDLSEAEIHIFGNLKRWRNEVASALEVPAYLIFDNKTLASIAHYKPISSEELSIIKGVGPEKLEKYGEDIISLVKQPLPTPKGRLMK